MMRFLLLCVFVLVLVTLPAQAQAVGEGLTFKRIGLFEIEDQTRKGIGKKIEELVKKEIEEAFRFEIVHRTETIQWPSQPEEILRLSQATGVDSVLAGRVGWADRSLKLTLALLEGETGKPFAIEFAVIRDWKKSENIENAVSQLVHKLVGRIPYKALVTEVKDNRVRFTAGTLHGVEKGVKATVFRIGGVQRHPFTQEVIGFQIEEVGHLTVTEVSERSSIATLDHVQAGKKIQEHDKIRFSPSQAALAQAEILKKELLAKQEQERVALEAQRLPALPKPTPITSTEKIRLTLQTSLLNNTFDFDSNELTFLRKAKGILAIELEGDVWLMPSWGIGLSYRQGGIQFDQLDNLSVDLEATPRWMKGGVQYQYLFQRLKTTPAVTAVVGYQLYQFKIEQQDQTFFVNYTLQGPFLGLEGAFPISGHFGIETGLEYFPWIDYREGSVHSGTGSRAMGYRMRGGLYHTLGKRMGMALGYSYEKYIADFNGVGTRGDAGVTDAHSQETYNGFHLNLTALF